MVAPAPLASYVLTSPPFGFHAGPAGWCVLTYSRTSRATRSRRASTHATCSGLVALCCVRILFVQNSALCHASATCAAGALMPMSGPWNATKESACDASASALRWLNASVRRPALASASAVSAAPTGARSVESASAEGFAHAATARRTASSASKHETKSAVASATSAPSGAARSVRARNGPSTRSANADTDDPDAGADAEAAGEDAGGTPGGAAGRSLEARRDRLEARDEGVHVRVRDEGVAWRGGSAMRGARGAVGAKLRSFFAAPAISPGTK